MQNKRLEYWVKSLTLFLGTCGICISLIYISADVISRYFFGEPLTGTIEVSAMLLAISASFLFTTTEIEDKHVRTTLLTSRFPPRIQLFQEGFSRLIGALILGLATFCVGVDTLHTWEFGDLTDVLLLPIAPFKLVFTLALGLFTVVLLSRGFKGIAKSTKGNF